MAVVPNTRGRMADEAQAHKEVVQRGVERERERERGVCVCVCVCVSEVSPIGRLEARHRRLDYLEHLEGRKDRQQLHLQRIHVDDRVLIL